MAQGEGPEFKLQYCKKKKYLSTHKILFFSYCIDSFFLIV
jgi:hypothetical protein